MICPNCCSEMQDGYYLHPSVGGVIRIVKGEEEKKFATPKLSVCPKCGKVEIYVDPEKLDVEAPFFY